MLLRMLRTGTGTASARTKGIINKALEHVGQGLSTSSLPPYPGLLSIWDYPRDVRRTLLASLDTAIVNAEDEARLITTSWFNKIKDMAETHLPRGVERNRRVFMPEAMFSTMYIHILYIVEYSHLNNLCFAWVHFSYALPSGLYLRQLT